MKHVVNQMQYRVAVIYETLSNTSTMVTYESPPADRSGGVRDIAAAAVGQITAQQ